MKNSLNEEFWSLPSLARTPPAEENSPVKMPCYKAWRKVDLPWMRGCWKIGSTLERGEIFFWSPRIWRAVRFPGVGTHLFALRRRPKIDRSYKLRETNIDLQDADNHQAPWIFTTQLLYLHA